MKQQRLKAKDRCQAILQALRAVFAEKGFDGTTTRDLAKAAGVSEALLYRHFPSKEAMYQAMSRTCMSERAAEEYKTILSLEPSASTLVVLTHFLVTKMVFEATVEKKALNVLAIRSMLENGDFMRVLHRERGSAWHKKLAQSLEAAKKAGEIEASVPATGDLGGWLAQALCFGMILFLQPDTPIIDTQAARAAMTERCVWFILLGLGLKAETIRKHYNAKALSLLETV